mgnify:CR=1 FL=1
MAEFDFTKALMLAMGGQQDLQNEEIEARNALSAAASQSIRPGYRALNDQGEVRGWGDTFKNPTEGQKGFALQAGLSLLGSADSTASLSSRIGAAIGTGSQAQQQIRATEQAQRVGTAQSRLDMIGSQRDNLSAQMGFMKDINTEQRAAASEGRAVAGEGRAVEDQAMQIEKNRIANLTPVQKLQEQQQEAIAEGNFAQVGVIQGEIDKAQGFGPSNIEVLNKQINNLRDQVSTGKNLIASGNDSPEIAASVARLEEDLLYVEQARDKAVRTSGMSVTTTNPDGTTTTVNVGGSGSSDRKRGSETKIDKTFLDQVSSLDNENSLMQRTIALMSEPSFQSVQGAIKGRVVQGVPGADILMSEEQQSALNRYNRINDEQVLVYAPLLKPMSDSDRDYVLRAMAVPIGVTPAAAISGMFTDKIPQALSRIKSAYSVFENDDPEYYPPGSADVAQMKMATDLVAEWSKGGISLAGDPNNPESIKGSIGYAMQNWFPQVNPALKGKGYYYNKQTGKMYPTSFLRNYLIQIRREANVPDYPVNELLKSLQLESY